MMTNESHVSQAPRRGARGRAPGLPLYVAAVLALACVPVAAAPQDKAAEREPAAQSAPAKTGGAAQEAAVMNGGETGAPASADDLRTRFREARTEEGRARLRRELVGRLIAEGREAEAAAELRALVSEERFDPAAYFNAGNALARLGESEAAADAYRKAITQRRGNYSRAQHNLGVVLVRLGRWEEALEALRAALRIEGGRYPDALYNLGRLHALRGEAAPAIDAWTRALAQRPDHLDSALALARALAEDGDAGRALSVLDLFDQRYRQRGADAPREVALARGEIVAALRTPKEPSREAAPGVRASGATPPEGVRRPFESRSVSAFSVDRKTYDLLRQARALREGGRYEEAVALYRQVVARRGGYFAPANLELSFSLLNLKRPSEAAETLEAITSRDGTRYPVAFFHLGRIYELAGQLARARAAYTRAAALYGEGSPQVLLDLARVREREGDAAGAAESVEAYIRATARLGSGSDWAQAYLARLRRKPSSPAPRPK